jgi:hypothetical protein
MPADQNHAGIRAVASNLGEGLLAVHDRHVDIRQDDVEFLGRKLLERIDAVVRLDDLAPGKYGIPEPKPGTRNASKQT